MLEDRYPEALGVECAWPAEWLAVLSYRQLPESHRPFADGAVLVEPGPNEPLETFR